MSYQKVRLTKRQIERMALVLALTDNVESVTIEQTNESGIGATMWAVYHTAKLEREWQEEITDVSTW
jgi:hypothetical protein